MTFELFLHDDRYSVPTLHLVSCANLAGARAAAEALLESGAHHRGVEVCQAGEHLLSLGVCAERRPTGFDATPLSLVTG